MLIKAKLSHPFQIMGSGILASVGSRVYSFRLKLKCNFLYKKGKPPRLAWTLSDVSRLEAVGFNRMSLEGTEEVADILWSLCTLFLLVEINFRICCRKVAGSFLELDSFGCVEYVNRWKYNQNFNECFDGRKMLNVLWMTNCWKPWSGFFRIPFGTAPYLLWRHLQ